MQSVESVVSSERLLVVKLGGAAGIDPQPTLADLASLAREGVPWVLVHGGNAELDDVSRRLGHAPRFVTSPSGHSSRVTDSQTIALIQMVYRGRINGDLVLRLQALGVNAVGLSGVDGALLRAARKEAVRVVEGGRKFLLKDDHTGRVHTVNTDLLRLLLSNGYHPVVTLPALADTGEAVNVDGDRAAAIIAASLGARDYLNLSNVPGLLRDPADPTSLVTGIPRDGLDGFEAFAQGRFKKKLLGVREALAGGVARVVLGSAGGEHPVRDALAGKGTVIA
ncbi:MAG TPA: [LysW]-aminoadipate kinase [Candidatus Thermoplasmatota archaeon]|nr:[LysW]-aminoadipate kinase [Candidatus Thermoplasmatota archaeon]